METQICPKCNQPKKEILLLSSTVLECVNPNCGKSAASDNSLRSGAALALANESGGWKCLNEISASLGPTWESFDVDIETFTPGTTNRGTVTRTASGNPANPYFVAAAFLPFYSDDHHVGYRLIPGTVVYKPNVATAVAANAQQTLKPRSGLLGGSVPKAAPAASGSLSANPWRSLDAVCKEAIRAPFASFPLIERRGVGKYQILFIAPFNCFADLKEDWSGHRVRFLLPDPSTDWRIV